MVKFVQTRWLTSYDMISRFILLREQIIVILKNNKGVVGSIDLTNVELYVLAIISKFLSVVKQASRVMEGSTYSTLSQSTILYIALINITRNFFSNESIHIPAQYTETFESAKSNFLSKMTCYYSKGSLLTFCAMVMDPRHKLSHNLLNESDKSYMVSMYILFLRLG